MWRWGDGMKAPPFQFRGGETGFEEPAMSVLPAYNPTSKRSFYLQVDRGFLSAIALDFEFDSLSLVE